MAAMGTQPARIFFLVLLAVAYRSSGQPLPAPTAASAPNTACLTALAASPFTSLNTLIQAAGLAPGLADVIANGEGGITIFAPSNAALAALPPASLKYLSSPENVDDLQALLLTHMVGQPLSASQLTPGNIVSLSGEPLTIGAQATSNLTIDKLPVTTPNAIATADCYVHGLGGVLVPSTLAPAAALNTTTTALQTPIPALAPVANLTNLTAPAPAPLAPAPAPANATLNLTSPAPAPAPLVAPAPAPAVPVNCSSLLTAAAATSNYTQLLAALSASNLTQVLQAQLGKTTTIFAPSDSALLSLSASVRSSLNANPAALQSVLSYHIANGYYPAAFLLTQDGKSVPSVNQGLPIPIKVPGQQVLVGFNQPPAAVTQPNLGLVNGSCVLHGIDQLIFPPGFILPVTNTTAPATAPATAAGASAGNATAAPLPTVTGSGADKATSHKALATFLLFAIFLAAPLQY